MQKSRSYSITWWVIGLFIIVMAFNIWCCCISSSKDSSSLAPQPTVPPPPADELKQQARRMMTHQNLVGATHSLDQLALHHPHDPEIETIRQELARATFEFDQEHVPFQTLLEDTTKKLLSGTVHYGSDLKDLLGHRSGPRALNHWLNELYSKSNTEALLKVLTKQSQKKSSKNNPDLQESCLELKYVTHHLASLLTHPHEDIQRLQDACTHFLTEHPVDSILHRRARLARFLYESFEHPHAVKIPLTWTVNLYAYHDSEGIIQNLYIAPHYDRKNLALEQDVVQPALQQYANITTKDAWYSSSKDEIVHLHKKANKTSLEFGFHGPRLIEVLVGSRKTFVVPGDAL